MRGAWLRIVHCDLFFWKGIQVILFRFYHPVGITLPAAPKKKKNGLTPLVAVGTGFRSFPQFTNVQLVLIFQLSARKEVKTKEGDQARLVVQSSSHTNPFRHLAIAKNSLTRLALQSLLVRGFEPCSFRLRGSCRDPHRYLLSLPPRVGIG